MLRRLSFAAMFVAAAFGAGSAAAGEAKVGPLTVIDAWARATIEVAKVGAAYLTIAHHGTEADRLVGVETPAAKRAMLHTNRNDGGVMRMRHVSAIDIAPGVRSELKPGGNHIMLMGLQAPLKLGTIFPMTLIFEKAGRIEVSVAVAAMGAKQAAGRK